MDPELGNIGLFKICPELQQERSRVLMLLTLC